MSSDKGTGKTTYIMEEAVRLLGELPDTSYVFITGAHMAWHNDLAWRFRQAGLTGVKFLTINQIRSGALRGCRGILLIDDFFDFPWQDRELLMQEKRFLKRT